MARVVLAGLAKSFPRLRGGTIDAVGGLDLTIEDGELLALVGPSGCGKTTTLRLIAGLDSPTRGRVLLGERDVTALPPQERDVAMVFQSHALYPHLTVGENLALGLKLRRTPRPEIEQRIRDVAKRLDLVSLLPQRPAALSGGEGQRVALARALVRRPRAFLLDEPLSHLDPPWRSHLRAEIARLHRELRATMIYVTHDHAEAMTLGQRIAVMNRGVLEQVGAPRNLYEAPANIFVAGFLGAPPMNFFHGTLVPCADGLCFQERASGVAGVPPFTLPLSPELASRLSKAAGQPMLLGLRPEHIMPGDGVDAGDTVAAVVERTEVLGAESHLHVRTGGHAAVARLPASAGTAREGPAALRFDLRRAHFFDPATGAALR